MPQVHSMFQIYYNYNNYYGDFESEHTHAHAHTCTNAHTNKSAQALVESKINVS